MNRCSSRWPLTLAACFFAKKTLEYDLGLDAACRTHMLAALKEMHPDIGKELETAVDATFTNFRGELDGARVDDNAILEILRTSDDAEHRRRAWEASKQVGAEVGDRVRFWVVNAGPTHPCAFHVVGEQFDTVYLGAPPGSPIRGVQTWNVPAGGGICFELLCDVPGEFPFVNHGFGHGQKGAVGFLSVQA